VSANRNHNVWRSIGLLTNLHCVVVHKLRLRLSWKHKQTKQPTKQTSKQASKQASKQTNKQTNNQTTKQLNKRSVSLGQYLALHDRDLVAVQIGLVNALRVNTSSGKKNIKVNRRIELKKISQKRSSHSVHSIR
jgi:hypothetical protein